MFMQRVWDVHKEYWACIHAETSSRRKGTPEQSGPSCPWWVADNVLWNVTALPILCDWMLVTPNVSRHCILTGIKFLLQEPIHCSLCVFFFRWHLLSFCQWMTLNYANMVALNRHPFYKFYDNPFSLDL